MAIEKESILFLNELEIAMLSNMIDASIAIAPLMMKQHGLTELDFGSDPQYIAVKGLQEKINAAKSGVLL